MVGPRWDCWVHLGSSLVQFWVRLVQRVENCGSMLGAVGVTFGSCHLYLLVGGAGPTFEFKRGSSLVLDPGLGGAGACFRKVALCLQRVLDPR